MFVKNNVRYERCFFKLAFPLDPLLFPLPIECSQEDMTNMTIHEFFKNDRYALASGIELLEAEPGRARAKMEIRDMHLNAGNVTQGGAIFTLADFAFAVAVNACGSMAVSVETSIRYFKSMSSGTLFAEAKVVNAHAKLATYESRVTNEKEDLVALFTATAYRKDIRLPFA